MNQYTERVILNITPEQKRKIAKLAKKDGRSITGYCRKVFDNIKDK